MIAQPDMFETRQDVEGPILQRQAVRIGSTLTEGYRDRIEAVRRAGADASALSDLIGETLDFIGGVGGPAGTFGSNLCDVWVRHKVLTYRTRPNGDRFTLQGSELAKVFREAWEIPFERGSR